MIPKPLKKENTLTNRLKCQGVPLDWFAIIASGPGFKRHSSYFCGFSSKLLAGLETSLTCQRRNYADFSQIGWIFAGKWTVFFANHLEKCRGTRRFWSSLMRGVGDLRRSFRWPLACVSCRFFSASGGGWEFKMLDDGSERHIESPHKMISHSTRKETLR